jgi:hypothetical protein
MPDNILFLLWRTTGSYEDTRARVIAGFKLRTSAESARKLCEDFFKSRPRPEFDEVTTKDGTIDMKKFQRFICPYDPQHVDESFLEVPRYEVGAIDVVGIATFKDPLTRFAQLSDRKGSWL